MLSPWKNMGDGLRDQDRKELCFCDLLSSVSLSGLICMLSQGKKARKNLNFKSQRNVKYRERRLKPRWGELADVLWEWVRACQPARSCLPPGNCLEQGRRLVLCCSGVFQSILLGALRYNCWASLAFQHQFWCLLILSCSYGGSFGDGWVWYLSLSITGRGEGLLFGNGCAVPHTGASPLLLAESFPREMIGKAWVTWMHSLNPTLLVPGHSTLELRPGLKMVHSTITTCSISFLSPFWQRENQKPLAHYSFVIY